MSRINNNSISSDKTDYSKIKNITKQNGGGFIDDLFKNNNSKFSNVSKMIIEASCNKSIEIIDYLLSQKFVPDLKAVDNDNNNLFHALIISHIYGSKLSKKAIFYILSNKDIKNKTYALNQKNKYGNTPLHYAIVAELDEIVTMMFANGAKKMKNADGYIPMTEIDGSNNNGNSNYDNYGISSTIGISDNNDNENYEEIIFRTELVQIDTSEDIKSDLENIIRNFQTDEETEMDFMTERSMVDNRRSSEKSIFEKNYDGKKSNSIFSDGGEFMTDDLKKYIDDIRMGKQIGGRKKKIKSKKVNKIEGFRNMKQFGGRKNDEIPESLTDEDITTSDNIVSSDLRELAREANNQKSKLHEEALEKIMKHLDKKNKDIITAKTIKALIYGELKENEKELSALDRANELVKRSNEKNIKKMMKHKNYEKLYNILKQKHEERQQKLSSIDETSKLSRSNIDSYTSETSIFEKNRKTSRQQKDTNSDDETSKENSEVESSEELSSEENTNMETSEEISSVDESDMPKFDNNDYMTTTERHTESEYGIFNEDNDKYISNTDGIVESSMLESVTDTVNYNNIF